MDFAIKSRDVKTGLKLVYKDRFSQEIQKTLNAFKSDFENIISKELDQKISAHLKNNFLGIATKVTSNFYESSSPFLKQAEEDLLLAHTSLFIFIIL